MTRNHTVRLRSKYARRVPGDVTFWHRKGEGTLRKPSELTKGSCGVPSGARTNRDLASLLVHLVLHVVRSTDQALVSGSTVAVYNSRINSESRLTPHQICARSIKKSFRGTARQSGSGVTMETEAGALDARLAQACAFKARVATALCGRRHTGVHTMPTPRRHTGVHTMPTPRVVYFHSVCAFILHTRAVSAFSCPCGEAFARKMHVARMMRIAYKRANRHV